MKHLLCIALLAAAGAASAAGNDLAEANRLLAAQSFDKALPMYQKLAQAGNPEAQLRLGEMLWFGDGTAPDLAQARQWFERAASAGNTDAAASLASLKRRETHGQDIAYWTTRYQGEDLLAVRAACTRTELPAFSRTKKEIERTADAVAAWHDCYNGFVDKVNAALPPGKRIPADVVEMMTPSEGKQAVAHLDAVYGKLIKDAEMDAQQFALSETAWRAATERYVSVNLPLNEANGYVSPSSQQNYQSSWTDRFSTRPVPQSPAQAAR